LDSWEKINREEAGVKAKSPQQCTDFDFALLRDLRESFAHFAVKGSSSAKLGHQVTFKSLKSNILPAIA
jgi:hypothetical protein